MSTGPHTPPPPPSPGRPIYEAIAYARTHPVGRIALAAIWLGAYLISSGTSHLYLELRRHPLVEVDR